MVGDPNRNRMFPNDNQVKVNERYQPQGKPQTLSSAASGGVLNPEGDKTSKSKALFGILGCAAISIIAVFLIILFADEGSLLRTIVAAITALVARLKSNST